MPPEPIATYRIQLRSGFGFEQATAVIGYLKDLGVSHFYASPYLQAAPGSAHGYDVEDPTRIDETLGGETGHLRFCQALQAGGLLQMIDLVPNHLSIAGSGNPWWWDVLEKGPQSRYAAYFDVDWQASEGRWPNKVLLPILGNQYGCILENKELRLFHKKGTFEVHYYDHRFPLNMASLSELLERAAGACGSDLLLFLAQCCAQQAAWPKHGAGGDQGAPSAQDVLRQLLKRVCSEEPVVVAAIDNEVARINTDLKELDALIDRQYYRLAFWRSAAGDLGYRRFFDINDLIGVRVEEAEVFFATHRLPLKWVRMGWVHGLRIDHPDGLWDPTEYFRQLKLACPDVWIVAEKILEPGETISPNWPIDGTTGYDFLNLAAGLFVDSRGLAALTNIYERFSGMPADYPDLVRQCKRQVLDELFGSELNRLTLLFSRVCERHRRYRDFTHQELRAALHATIVAFPVYRTYVQASLGAVTQMDEHYVGQAIGQAIALHSELDPDLFRFLEELLLLRVTGALEGELAMRFQQLTGPVMAKGVEDTAFYRFHRLVSLNEVGADPDHYPVAPDDFHRFCAESQTSHPHSMLAGSTHDTKRSEDVRARLALLSEIPALWGETVDRWAERNDRHRRNRFLDRNTEYLFYQTLVGAWPIDAQRMVAYMGKAAREAKAHTSWTRQKITYERDLADFIQAVMSDAVFSADLEKFVSPLVLPGRINALAQTLLKLTAPGVPDIYQGTELWDLSLVDPDNRRPVDFDLRQRLLAQVPTLGVEEIMARMDEGVPKLWLIRQALHLRRERPELFGRHGAYQAVAATGPMAAHAVAFLRGKCAMTIVPRLLLGLQGDWADSSIELPPGRWRNILTADPVDGGTVSLNRLLTRFPVALLLRED
jgi:(1->4)-alpha-D-glucan 1-alpha-D-glucosylmutase